MKKLVELVSVFFMMFLTGCTSESSVTTSGSANVAREAAANRRPISRVAASRSVEVENDEKVPINRISLTIRCASVVRASAGPESTGGSEGSDRYSAADLRRVMDDELRREQRRQQAIARNPQGPTFGRQLLIARDKLIVAFAEYRDMFTVVSRVDGGMPMRSLLCVEVVISAPKEDSVSTCMGGTTIKKSTQKLPIIMTVRDLHGTVIFAKELAAVKTTKSSSAFSVRGVPFDYDELMTDAFKQAVKAFYEELKTGKKTWAAKRGE